LLGTFEVPLTTLAALVNSVAVGVVQGVPSEDTDQFEAVSGGICQHSMCTGNIVAIQWGGVVLQLIPSAQKLGPARSAPFQVKFGEPKIAHKPTTN